VWRNLVTFSLVLDAGTSTALLESTMVLSVTALLCLVAAILRRKAPQARALSPAAMEDAAQQHLQMRRGDDGEARHCATRHRIGEQSIPCRPAQGLNGLEGDGFRASRTARASTGAPDRHRDRVFIGAHRFLSFAGQPLGCIERWPILARHGR